jgi:hypothetical protein
MLISKNLRATLRFEGYTKVAAQVMRDQGEYVGDISHISGAMKSLAVKVAANLENERIVSAGIQSFRRFQEL